MGFVVSKENSFAVDVEEGKNLLLMFTCESKKQPFCDGAHKNSLFYEWLKYLQKVFIWQMDYVLLFFFCTS